VLLIVTERRDLHADWLILELEKRTAPFVRFNTQDYPQRTGLTWSSAGSAVLRIDGRSHDLAAFTSIWYRRPVPPVMPSDMDPHQAAWARGEAQEALMGVWRTLDHLLWVNHPDRNRLAQSKPSQLRVAAALGFDVPEALITNDRLAAEEFARAQQDGAICKPLRDGRVPGDKDRVFFTSALSNNELPLSGLGREPYLFQARVPKRYDVRVTVIGNDVMAARIYSQQQEDARTDWRRGATSPPHEVEALPAELAARCVDLCRHYGLRFGAIDLARRPDGGYSFFEVNPNGQWAWVEQRTGLPLRARLADLLVDAQVVS
jgi:glutathione synthase/RimK-type ligase-like ATP-grasp enzyme